MMEKREFYINTPIGKLKVWAKHDVDNPQDFPGVYVDFIGAEEDILLACVEYDSVSKGMYTRVYGDVYDDAPTDSIPHENLEDFL